MANNDPISLENAVRGLVGFGQRLEAHRQAVKRMESRRITFPAVVDEQTEWEIPGIGTFPLDMEKRARTRLGCASHGFKFREGCDACSTATPQSETADTQADVL